MNACIAEISLHTSLPLIFALIICSTGILGISQTVQQQLDKLESKKIYPTEFMFTDRKELKIDHNETAGWILATESSNKV